MNGAPSPNEYAELYELIQLLYDRNITAEELARLETWIYQDKEARRIYVQYMNLYASLHWEKSQEFDLAQNLPDQTSKTVASPILGFLADTFEAGVKFFPRGMVISLVMTIGLPVVLLAVLLLNAAREPIPQAPPTPSTTVAVAPEAVAPLLVAKVTRTCKCEWNKGETPLPIGAGLFSHQKITLTSGLLEITFANGSMVLLEGPVTFNANNGNTGFLHCGRLVAKVPKQGVGFTVQTPLATIVDLGTEFGVAVDKNGTAEAYVFKGAIEIDDASPTQTIPLRQLHAGQAARIQFANNGKTIQMKEIALAPNRFTRRVPPKTNAGLPEPRIIFSHQGDRDPTSEGWSFLWEPKTAPRLENIDMKPVAEDGVAAWAIDDRSTKMGVTYRVVADNGMNEEMIAQGRTHGWVIRARIMLTGVRPPKRGLGFLSFWDGHRAWKLHPTLDERGNQALFVFSQSSLGQDVTIDVPNSRNRYVDYEVRYHPETDDADIYINGRLAATKVFKPQRGPYYSFHFGTGTPTKVNIRFARVEWGILDQASQQEETQETGVNRSGNSL